MSRKNEEEKDILPWERQEGETAKQYEAFAIYRDMGVDRSYPKVARVLSKSSQLMQRWCSANKWVERAEKWDREQDRLNRIQQQKDIAKMRKNHAAIASSMLVKASKALLKLKDDEIKAQDITRMVDVASKLERISRGDVGEVIEERDGGESAPAVTFYMPDNGRD